MYFFQVYLTETQIEEKLKSSELGTSATKKLAKSVDNTNYNFFDEHEFNDLPGGFEAIQLLSSVTNKMGFKVLFNKYYIMRSLSNLYKIFEGELFKVLATDYKK